MQLHASPTSSLEPAKINYDFFGGSALWYSCERWLTWSGVLIAIVVSCTFRHVRIIWWRRASERHHTDPQSEISTCECTDLVSRSRSNDKMWIVQGGVLAQFPHA